MGGFLSVFSWGGYKGGRRLLFVKSKKTCFLFFWFFFPRGLGLGGESSAAGREGSVGEGA